MSRSSSSRSSGGRSGRTIAHRKGVESEAVVMQRRHDAMLDTGSGEPDDLDLHYHKAHDGCKATKAMRRAGAQSVRRVMSAMK